MSVASKALRDEKVDLKCTNGNVTEKTHYTSRVM